MCAKRSQDRCLCARVRLILVPNRLDKWRLDMRAPTTPALRHRHTTRLGQLLHTTQAGVGSHRSLASVSYRALQLSSRNDDLSHMPNSIEAQGCTSHATTEVRATIVCLLSTTLLATDIPPTLCVSAYQRQNGHRNDSCSLTSRLGQRARHVKLRMSIKYCAPHKAQVCCCHHHHHR